MNPNQASPAGVAQHAIDADLRALTREKRRHFLPAFVAWVAVAAVVFSIAGIRGSLLEQPWWQILAQVGVWTLCLGVLPAVGLGVIFPTARTKALLICAALVLTIAGSFDWSVNPGGPWLVGPCFALQTVVGVALLAIGGWSGAFLQRARPAAGFWIASGVAMAALNTSTWHCADTTFGHVVPNHIGGGVAMLLCAAILGHFLHRRAFDA
jgi:hypothetical protein